MKPEVLSRKQIEKDTGYTFGDKVWGMIQDLLIDQRDDTFKKTIELIKNFHRDEGGLELLLSWKGIIIDEPDWQALQKEED